MNSKSSHVNVVARAPFWQWAVGPLSQNSPAIPFYRKVSAVAFFKEVSRDIPWFMQVLYRRKGWNKIQAVCYSTENTKGQYDNP